MTEQKFQSDKINKSVKDLNCNQNETRFEESVQALTQSKPEAKVCPECNHIFKGNGWDGIDAHWRSKHEDVMPYEQAWQLLKSGKYS